MALHTSLCQRWQANAFRVSFWWRAAGAAYPAATRQGKTHSTCDVAHTRFFDTAHQMRETETAQSTFHRRALDRVMHRTRTGPDAFLAGSRGLHPSLLPPLRKSCLCVCVSLCRCVVVSVCLCVCVCVCACGCLVCLCVEQAQ